MRPILVLAFCCIAVSCVSCASHEEQETKPTSDAKLELIIRAFNETQRRLIQVQDEMQEWMSSRPDSFFLNNSMSAIKSSIRRANYEIANTVLRDFESSSLAKVPITIADGDPKSAELVLRKTLVSWIKKVKPKQENLARIMRQEAMTRSKDSSDGKKSSLAYESPERLEAEKAIALAGQDSLKFGSESFWRELVENLAQLIVVVTRLWKLITTGRSSAGYSLGMEKQ